MHLTSASVLGELHLSPGRLENLYLDMAEAQRLPRLAFKHCSLHLLTGLKLKIDQVRPNAMKAKLRSGTQRS